jgi:acetylxylan esterase
MAHRRTLTALATSIALSLLAPAAWAADPVPVSNWQGGGTFPSDVSMSIYVPAKVVAKPPVLALIHYCGGTAQDVFGQARGGGLVDAADKYGFIMVVPSSGRCWDITSAKAQKRDGGGDPHAIAQMVKYAISQYKGNAERVYATGDSSGGMTTQLLLALYPDVFKAGSAFAGVAAGCKDAFAMNGLCGLGAQTAQQWGDRARALDPGYTGHRPRVQLFHGNNDMTIFFPNFGEAIKEWTNVLGFPASPTMTDMNVTLGTHKATRQRWKNQCGFVTLDTFESIGGDHGPSDALFKAEYVVPFLGLDKVGDVDPEIEQCAPGGMGGAGGAGGGSSGGASGAGGGVGTGGAGGAAAGSGGAPAGGSASGGTGGAVSSAGSSAQAGSPQGTAGAPASAGQTSTSGSAGVSPAGSGATSDDATGCTCAMGKKSSNGQLASTALAIGLALMGLARRRRTDVV